MSFTQSNNFLFSNNNTSNMPPSVDAPATNNNNNNNKKATTTKRRESGRWSEQEHAIFLQGLEFRPSISWKAISKMIQTRTARQTRTHAQKYFEKLKRHETRKLQQQLSMESARSFSSDVTTTCDVDFNSNNAENFSSL